MLSPVDPLPLVSIVTPSFQQGTFIERTIESVLGQDYPHIEYLVVDGGSTDRTLEVLQTCSHRIRWISRRDRGQSDAINQGLRAARGEILAYLNSDDTYQPGAVRKAVLYLVAHPTCDLVYGQGRFIDRDDKVIGSLPSPPFDAEGFARSCFIFQPATFWRRRLHDRIGYFDEEEHLVMDYEFFLRAARTARIAMIEDTLAEARIWEGAKSVASRARQARGAIEAVHRYRGSVPINWIDGYVWATLEGLPFGGLPRYLRIALRRLLARWMQTRLLFRYNGLSALAKHWISVEPRELYADGWMGEALQRTVSKPLGATHVRITGELPAASRDLLQPEARSPLQILSETAFWVWARHTPTAGRPSTAHLDRDAVAEPSRAARTHDPQRPRSTTPHSSISWQTAAPATGAPRSSSATGAFCMSASRHAIADRRAPSTARSRAPRVRSWRGSTPANSCYRKRCRRWPRSWFLTRRWTSSTVIAWSSTSAISRSAAGCCRPTTTKPSHGPTSFPGSHSSGAAGSGSGWEAWSTSLSRSHWDLILRFRAAGAKFARIPRFLGALRIGSEQTTDAHMETNGHPEIARIRERYHGRVVSKGEIDARLRPYLRRHLLYHKLSRLGALAAVNLQATISYAAAIDNFVRSRTRR